VKQLEDISRSKEGSQFMNEMPFDAFLDFISHDNIEISEEIDIVKMITKYLQKRNSIMPLLPEEDPVNDLTHLTEEEKKVREVAKAKHVEEEKKKHVEEEKKNEDKVKAMDELGKI
jgi:hypothetical protein